jgi:hypothetical protein
MGFFAELHKDFTEEHMEEIIAEETEKMNREAEEAEIQRERYMDREYRTIRARKEGIPESERVYDSLDTALRNIKDNGKSVMMVNGDVFMVQFLYTVKGE